MRREYDSDEGFSRLEHARILTPPPPTSTKSSKFDPPENSFLASIPPSPTCVSRSSDVVRTRVFDWGRQIFFSLNYMEVQQTEGLNNWDSTVFVLVYTTQAE